MSKKVNRKVPKLRFPDFEGDWENSVIANYVKEYKERVSSNTNLTIYTSSREGLKPQIEFFANREVLNENEYGVVPHGFFVYRHMSDDSIFKFNINDLGKKIAVSKEYPVFTTTENLNSSFLLYKLNYGNDFKQFAVTQEKGGTRTRLYFKNLRTWKTLIPLIAEQEKIASFLGAVDTRLTQLRRKHQLLQTYKRGVMQKLFSQQIRFKCDDGKSFPDWEKKKLGEIFLISAGGDIELSRVKKEKDEIYQYPIYANADKEKGLYGYSDQYKFEGGAITVTGRGNLGFANVRDHRFYPIVRLLILRPKLNLNIWFFENYINRIHIYAETTGVPQLTAPQISSYKVDFPYVKEQEKIADFLTAIDKKIEAVAQQIDLTEKFKKGLLQKMFV